MPNCNMKDCRRYNPHYSQSCSLPYTADVCRYKDHGIVLDRYCSAGLPSETAEGEAAKAGTELHQLLDADYAEIEARATAADHDIYGEHGFASRREYLDSLAEEYGTDRRTVYTLADLLGPSEDFDGLVSALNDL